MKNTLTIILSGLLLCGCSQKKASSVGPAIDPVQAGKDISWRDGNVLYVTKRDGTSLEQTANSTNKFITLKSHGVAVAELRLLTRDSLAVNSMKQNLDATTGVLTAKGGVTIQLGSAGDSQIIIKADEVEVSPIAK